MTSSPRRLVVYWGAIPTLVVSLLCVGRPTVFARLEYGVYDRMVRWAGTTRPAGRVVIVDVDEASLEAIGQWPWPRATMASLITQLRASGAAVVALDIMFPESDRRGESGEGSDEALAASLRQHAVALGYALTFDAPNTAAARPCAAHPAALAIVHRDDDDTGEPYFQASRAVCNIDMLMTAAAASGFLNAAPDIDGILRRVPLLLEFQGRVYPSLALAAVTAALKTRPAMLRVVNVNASSLMLDDITSDEAAPTEVPLDGKSNLLVRYRGVKQTFPHVSAADVLNGAVSPGTFTNKVVFVGTTALGTREVVATPLDTLFTGLEVQATVADNLLQRDFFYRAPHAPALEALAVLLLGLTVTVVTAWRGLALGSLTAAVLGGAAWALSIAMLARHGVLLSPLFPCIELAGAVAAMTVAGATLERRRADTAGREQVASQRLMVQTLLSLVEMRDPETGRHSRRTQRYTRLLAEALMTHPRFQAYLTRQRVDLLAALAPLHDIGKVAVPQAILDKPGPLTAQEFAEIRKHPAYGREVIENAEKAAGVRDDLTMAIAKDIVYTHHEKWDGTGYPRGLRGSDIPIPGRLMALVDVYDALRSCRPYHGPRSHDDVTILLVADRGKHFDPQVVDAYIQVAETFRSLSEASDLEDVQGVSA